NRVAVFLRDGIDDGAQFVDDRLGQIMLTLLDFHLALAGQLLVIAHLLLDVGLLFQAGVFVHGHGFLFELLAHFFNIGFALLEFLFLFVELGFKILLGLFARGGFLNGLLHIDKANFNVGGRVGGGCRKCEDQGGDR